MEHLAQHVEALIFASSSPISFQEILDCLEATFEMEFSEEDLEKAIAEIVQRYEDPTFSFELLKIAGGYNFLTKSAYFSTIGTHLKLTTRKRLSKSALETLALVAYKQPVSKTEMENIRGVGCDYALQKLLEKELVVIAGRSEGPGRPLLYGTSEKFMDYFGLKALEDLPKPKDFQMPDNMIGEQAPLEESVPTAVEGEAQGDSGKESEASAKEGEEAKIKSLPPIEMTAEEIEASLVEVVPKTEEELLAESLEKEQQEVVENAQEEGIAVGETIELSPEIEGKIEEELTVAETEEKSEVAIETGADVEHTPEVIVESAPEIESISEVVMEEALNEEPTVTSEIEAEVVPQTEVIVEAVEEISMVEIAPEIIAEDIEETEPISEVVMEVVLEEEQVVATEIEAEVTPESESEQTSDPIVILENEKFEEE